MRYASPESGERVRQRKEFGQIWEWLAYWWHSESLGVGETCRVLDTRSRILTLTAGWDWAHSDPRVLGRKGAGHFRDHSGL